MIKHHVRNIYKTLAKFQIFYEIIRYHHSSRKLKTGNFSAISTLVLAQTAFRHAYLFARDHSSLGSQEKNEKLKRLCKKKSLNILHENHKKEKVLEKVFSQYNECIVHIGLD